jgi:hypothetical protein
VRTLAALVLLTVVAAGCTADDPAPQPQGRVAATLTPSPPASPPQPLRPPSLDDLPTGPPPRIAYADENVIVHPDGRRERLVGQRRIGVSAFTRFRDGWLVADGRWFEGTVGLAYVAGHQRDDLGPCASGGAVVSQDRERVAWMTQFCPESGLVAPTLVHVASSADEEQREIQRVGIASVVGFVGDEVVVSGYDGVDLVGPGGSTRPLPLRYATDTNDGHGLVAGLLPRGQAFGAVVDARTGQVLWRRRHTEPAQLSPDGRHLAAYVRRRPALLDAATGRTVAIVRGAGLGVFDWEWEDDRHLLALAQRQGRMAIVRIDLRGHVSRVGPITQSVRWQFVLETQP